MLCRMDIHNFPSMPSEPNSTAACRFSSWNIMGHSHSLVEKCWKRFGAFKTLLPVPVEAENSTFRWASLEMCWNVLNQKDPTMNICLFFCVFSSEKYIIMRGCWLNFGEVIPCHTMSYPLFHAMPSLCKCSGCSAPTTRTSWRFRLANKKLKILSPIFSILYTWWYMYF